MGLLKEQWIAAARTGNPYALLRLKEALKGLESAAAHDVYERALGPGAPAELVNVAAVSMCDAARRGARTYIETGASGLPFVNRPPRVIGAHNSRDLHGLTRSAYLACFSDARIRSLSHAIEWNGEILLDFEDWELDRIDDRLELDPNIFRSSGKSITYIRHAERPTDFRVPRCFMLTGCHTLAFGHWMWEYLPKILAAIETGGLAPMPVAVDAGMPASHREALERMLPEGFSILTVPAGASVCADELWCAPSLFYMPQLEIVNARFRWDVLAAPPDRFHPVLHRMGRSFASGDAALNDGRIYLARRPQQRRKLENQTAIEALVRAHGFLVIYPEDYVFAEQARLIRQARHVIAPEGSAEFLMFLARPGSRLLVLNHTITEGLPVFTALVQRHGIDVTVMTGPITRPHQSWPHFSDYRVDESVLAAFLDQWLSNADGG
jgi:Glycosyltransferase 61